MKIATPFLTIFFLMTSFSVYSQNASSLPGVWKGTSICQQKNSPCHDEIAVYHISKTAKANIFEINGNKLVNNKEEEMGILYYTYDAAKQTMVSVDEAHGNRCEFKINGTSMEGTLMSKGELYRIIKLKKDN